MIDLHSHILPKFDDGAKSVEESLEMLRESKKQGVDKIVASSHCYPRNEDSIKSFIDERAAALENLREEIRKTGEDLPEIYAGCELNICRDFSDEDNLKELCIEGTDYLLIEMPYEPWSESVVEVVYKTSLKGIRPIMAHIDRFLYQRPEMLRALFELDVLFQINAEAFLDKRMIKMLEKLFDAGRANVIGTDMHNLSNRKPCMGVARDRILKCFGQDYWEYIQNNNVAVLQNMEIDPFAHKKLTKKTIIQRLFGK